MPAPNPAAGLRIHSIETGPLFDDITIRGSRVIRASAEVIWGVAGYDPKTHPCAEMFKDVNKRVAVARLWHIDPTNPDHPAPEGSTASPEDTAHG